MKKSPRGVKSLIRFAEGLFEIAVLTFVYFFVWRRGYDGAIFPAYLGRGQYVLSGVYALLTLALFFAYDGFKFGYLRMTDAVISQVLSLFIVNFITYWQLCLIANVMISPIPMLVVLVFDFVIALLCVIFFTWVYHRVYTPKNMAMVLGRDDAVTLKFKMETRLDKYRINKLIPVEIGFSKICEQLHQYDAVIINDVAADIRNDLLKYCYRNEIRTYVTPKLSDIIIRGATKNNLFDTPLFLVKGQGMTSVQCFFKRAMDLMVCVPAVLIASPIMLAIAIAIKLEDGGPVFYKQARATLGGKVFDILKFRSMIVDAEKDGRSIPATGQDPRITKVGRITRATRIDELPQLLNIIKGDMSLVGPRPERLEHVEKYSKEIPEFEFRTKVKGGLTGYAQIYGKYNTSAYDKLRLDLMYIENYSLMLDIKLILMTVRIMLSKESTEGFEKITEEQRKKEEILKQMQQEIDEAQEAVGMGQ